MIEALESRFASTPLLPLPTGPMWGRFLAQLPDQSLAVRAVDALGFRLLPFGVDFTHYTWFFLHERLRTGRFTATPGPSRWRDTQVYRIDYAVSRLPIRGILYDEVKPMPDGSVLGLGGINAEKGRGEHFFFELIR